MDDGYDGYDRLIVFFLICARVLERCLEEAGNHECSEVNLPHTCRKYLCESPYDNPELEVVVCFVVTKIEREDKGRLALTIAAYYKKETSTLEEAFFVRTADSLIPVEVKAGNTVSKSLRTLIASDHYPEIKEGIKFAHANIGRTETITTFPYFCSFLLKRYLEKR